MLYNFEIVPVTQELILKNSVNPDRGRSSKETTEVISKVVEYKTTVQKMKMFHHLRVFQSCNAPLVREQRTGVYLGQKRYSLKTKVVSNLSPNLETCSDCIIIGVRL